MAKKTKKNKFEIQKNEKLDSLKNLNRQVCKWSMVTFIILSLILLYKIYTFIHSSVSFESFSILLEMVLYKVKKLLDSLNGWSVFWALVSTSVISIMICSYVQEKITKQGGTLIDEDEL